MARVFRDKHSRIYDLEINKWDLEYLLKGDIKGFIWYGYPKHWAVVEMIKTYTGYVQEFMRRITWRLGGGKYLHELPPKERRKYEWKD